MTIDPDGMGAAALGERVLVLAPMGRDAPLLCQLLNQAGLTATACSTEAEELARPLQDSPGAVLLTEEALAPAVVAALCAALRVQPPWSDIPVLLLAGCRGAPLQPASMRAIAELRAAGSLSVLERPVSRLALVTAVEAARRARRRQYQLRDLIVSERAARRQAEIALQLGDEFLATVSHELRTPLNATLLWSRVLVDQELGANKLRQGASAIMRSAEAQSKLIEDLLDMSRMVSGKLSLNLQEVALAPLVQAASDIVQPTAEAKNIQLDIALATARIQVRADSARIQQVVWNLLSNAVKFTPPGGRVSVRLERAGDRACITITDTGKGISPQFLPHVFERFRQADATAQRQHGGLGLGLAISHHLVELHGGTLHADSPGEGLGAVFTVGLPLAAGVDSIDIQPGCADGLPGAHQGIALPCLADIRVLLVEDDPDTREAMACVLEQHGAEVVAVDSAEPALELLAAAIPGAGPQVMLIDLAMPRMDGYELLRRIRAMEDTRGQPTLPAAMITAHARPGDRERALQTGFAAYMAKPVEPEHLAAMIAELTGPAGRQPPLMAPRARARGT